ncbi:PRELI domain-containing protein 1, mitochondrial isoform X1 [Salmo salar]|uniref:PRELI domain-containing protein 1, mitochondrial isoform X1 n=1 Tax=Salmo salar TaxID=8030 RepID=A0A1S3SWZ1_SALSA|nr:PRELI domain containing 1a isoform X1 [Salmo salar]|eukprot:XP_014068863.1 PREDICTED: PRELI domain-containing protein 1, mitochondrial isoform X1 [Salmo salar]
MGKYFACVDHLKSSWDQVCIAFWERYPNPYSNHVLTEDIIFREVTPGNCLVSRRLLTKTNRAPRWMEKYLPVTMARHAYIIEDSIVDPQNRTMTTLTWNISHARMMSVEERCEYRINPDNTSWTEINREAWISSNLYGLSRAIQEFGLARFKTSVAKTMKGFEYVLAKMQETVLWSGEAVETVLWSGRNGAVERRSGRNGTVERRSGRNGTVSRRSGRNGETPSRTLAEHATERARVTALAAKEKAKDLASQAHKKQQYV